MTTTTMQSALKINFWHKRMATDTDKKHQKT